MGYRSDVGLALSKAGADSLQKKLNSLDKDSVIFFNVTELLKYAYKHQKHEETGAELFLWDYLKWYDNYSDVRFIEDLMVELEDEEFLFLRIGEDRNDNEERGSFWDNPFQLSILRTITSI
jgi:hypothetical protein